MFKVVFHKPKQARFAISDSKLHAFRFFRSLFSQRSQSRCIEFGTLTFIHWSIPTLQQLNSSIFVVSQLRLPLPLKASVPKTGELKPSQVTSIPNYVFQVYMREVNISQDMQSKIWRFIQRYPYFNLIHRSQ